MRVQQHRKHPLPVVRAVHGHGIFRLEHGEPTIPVRSPAAGASSSSSTGEAPPLWSAVCSQTSTAGRHPWGEDDAWWRQADQQSPYRGAVSFSATGSAGTRATSRL